MRALLLHTAALSMTLGLASGVAPVFEKKPEHVDHSVGTLIPYHEGVLAISRDFPGVLEADWDTPAARPLKVVGMDHVIDVQAFGTEFLFLGWSQERFQLAIQSANKEIRMLELPEELRRLRAPMTREFKGPRLVPTTTYPALVADYNLHWLEGEKWRRCPLPREDINFYFPFHLGSESEVSACFRKTTLFAGLNDGEWGGKCASIQADAPKPKWIRLNGRPRKDPGGFPGTEAIIAIACPLGKDLWIASGSSHLMSHSKSLHCRSAEDGKWRSVVDYSPEDPFKIEERNHGSLELPDKASLDCLAADKMGRFYILADRRGIYELREELVPMMDFDFPSISAKIGGATSHCASTSFAASGRNQFYVGTNGFGILAFRKEDDAWAARQILVTKD